MENDALEWSRIIPSRRYVARQLRKGTRGSIIKALAELIKNADDTYDRSKVGFGRIEIGYWKLRRTQRRSISGFYVRDWGQGMTQQTATQAYKHYGEDTSTGGRNAAIGVGGKDALLGMSDCFVFTVNNGTPLVIEVRTDPIHNDLESRITLPPKAGSQFEVFNSRIGQYATPVNLSESGTTVAFRIPHSQSGPRLETILEGLSNYYTLRTIMEDKNRQVELLDLDSGQRTTLSHKPLDGETVCLKNFEIEYRTEKFAIEVEIKRFAGNINKDKESGYALLVTDERGAVLDNTMAGFEDIQAANPFFGKAVITNWRRLYDIDETVLTDNREGLDYNNEFNRELRNHLHQILKKLVEEKGAGEGADLNKTLRRKVLRAFSKINELIRKEDLSVVETEEEIETTPESIAFSPSKLSVTVGHKRYLTLLVNADKVPPGSTIALSVAARGVEVVPDDFLVTSSTYDVQPTQRVSIAVTAQELSGNAVITAKYKEMQAQAEVSVAPEEELQPASGFAFVPDSRTILKGPRKRLRLVIDTRVVPQRSLVTLTCNDDRIKLLNFERLLVGSPNLSLYLREEFVEISAETPGVRAQVCARSRTAEGRELITYCTLRIAERDPPKEFLKDYKLDPAADERQRANYENGIVCIHTRSPVLSRYFGNPSSCERLKENEPDAVVLLADTIVQCVTENWARYQIDAGVVTILSDDVSEEVRRQARKLDYLYGKTIHEIIMSSLS
jgi:hypothetical protein